MKILYCLAETCNSGGTERIVISKANWLAEKGHDVVIATTEQGGRPDFFALHPAVRRVDFEIHYLIPEQGNAIRKQWRRVNKKQRHRRLLAALLQAEAFDFAISTFGNEIRFLHAMADGSKKILEIHMVSNFRKYSGRKGLMGLYDKYLTRLDRLVARKYDKFVCLTRRDASKWGGLPNVVAIPNFITLSAPGQTSELREPRMIAAGRLHPAKGFDRMIQAWQVVAAKHPAWRLDIFGDGPDEARLRELIAQCGLQEQVRLNHAVAEIGREYARSSAILLTSFHESWGLVLLEGMACGLPAVAFDVDCGPAEIISDGVDGFLIADGDVQAFGRALCRLIESEPLRREMGRAAVARAGEFAIDVVMERWLALFSELKK